MLAFLGGTGPEGKSLALRFALAGEEVLIGSRDQSRARQAAESLQMLVPGTTVAGDTNSVAAEMGDTAFITVPYVAQKVLLEQVGTFLATKVVVDVVAPLSITNGRATAMPIEAGSAAMEAQQLLPDSYVVAAFQNISATELMIPDKIVEGDVVVCSNHQEPKELVMGLVEKIESLRPVDGDGLENAKYLEQLTALLLNINRIYKAHSMIKIMGI